MKLLLVAAVLVAAFWVWRHNTVSDTKACVTAPARVCVDRPQPSTTRRR